MKWGTKRFQSLYDTANDPAETENRRNGADEKRMVEMLREALRTVEAPAEQFQRLGLL